MQEYVKYQEVITETKIIRVTCDKCGSVIYEDGKSMDGYSAYNYDWFEYKSGTSYPEGGWGEKVILDLCKSCSICLITLMNENGYDTRVEEWEY